jgi:hypothetical protein
MRLSRSSLALLLMKNVAEVRFRRRKQKPGHKTERRMLCTNDRLLLNSIGGKNILNFKAPTGQLKFNPAAKNLLVVWDIFLQNWRMINCDDVDVVAIIQSTPADKWWKYFNESILPLSTQQKATFNNT